MGKRVERKRNQMRWVKRWRRRKETRTRRIRIPRWTPLEYHYLQILPPNLVFLNILEVGNWKKKVGKAVLELVGKIQTGKIRFGNLGEIRAWSDELWPSLEGYERSTTMEGVVDDWDPQVEELAAAVGIRFRIEPTPEPPMMAHIRQLAQGLTTKCDRWGDMIIRATGGPAPYLFSEYSRPSAKSLFTEVLIILVY
ncbi:hypothetical protein VTK26DRAFT_380 [Humicola hyalothermophila]